MKKKIILWTLCILWMSLIFMFSHQNAELSSDISQGFTARIIMLLAEHNIIDIPVSSSGLSEAVLKIAESIDTVVRKLAHFSIYGVLGILTYELSLCYYKRKKAAAAALITCLLYAISDEIHQLFIPGRAGMVIDVILDFSGSIFALFMYYFIIKREDV